MDYTHDNMLDPTVRSRSDRQAGHTGSYAVIDACRPFAVRSSVPKVAGSSADFKKFIREKWSGILHL
jgi:hypothetical protein